MIVNIVNNWWGIKYNFERPTPVKNLIVEPNQKRILAASITNFRIIAFPVVTMGIYAGVANYAQKRPGGGGDGDNAVLSR